MADTKQLLLDLSSVIAVSGFEALSDPRIAEIASPCFDEHFADNTGSLIFIKRCGIENAKKILLDAHRDEIGMIVTDIKDDGTLTVGGLGGLDRRTIAASEVTLYADREIYGVIELKPVTALHGGDAKKLPKVSDLFIDTGYTKDELVSFGVKVGTPATIKSSPLELLNGQTAYKAFDNRASAASIISAVSLLSDKPLSCDIYMLLSSEEESFGIGAATGAFRVRPDEAIVVDVDFGTAPDTDKHKTVDIGGGPSVCVSIEVDRAMTKKLIALAKEKGIPVQPNLSPSSTGTNAGHVAFTAGGIKTACVGIPLKNMHTPSEVIQLEDIENTAKLIAAYIESEFKMEASI